MTKKMTAMDKLYASLWCRLGRVLDLLTEDDGHIADEIDPVRYELHTQLPDSYKARSFNDNMQEVVEEMQTDSDKVVERVPATYKAVGGVMDAAGCLLQDVKRTDDPERMSICRLEVSRLRNALQAYNDVQ